MEKCSAIKRNEVLITATTWTNFESIIRKRIQLQKTYILNKDLYEIKLKFI